MWNAIGPVRTIAGLLRYRRAGVSIGAAIQVNFAAARDECAILSHAGLKNDHAYGTERQTENTRELLANGKWALCRAPHREHAGFEVRDANMRLHRIVLGAGKIKNVFEDAV